MDMQIHHTWNLAHLVEQFTRVNPIGVDIEARHLYIDRRGQPEIQNLADDIRG